MKNEQGEEILEEGALPSEEAEETNLESKPEEESVETTESGEDSNANEVVDYKTELEKERERLGLKIDKERQKRIEAQKGSMPREEVEKLINEKVGQVEKQMFRERATIIAERLAKSPAEKELIMLHYDHSILPTGNLEEDMDMAYTLANRKKTQGTISELQNSLKSKKTISSGGSDAGAPPIEQKPKQKYSQEILDGAKFVGVTPEEFVKKLGK